MGMIDDLKLKLENSKNELDNFIKEYSTNYNGFDNTELKTLELNTDELKKKHRKLTQIYNVSLMLYNAELITSKRII
jgi:hypothetical protein